MDIVAAMQVFVRVAEAGGFTSVARETRTTPLDPGSKFDR